MLKIDRDRMLAEVASLDAIIESLPENDFLGRISLKARLEALVESLSGHHLREDHKAKIALYFGGEPVVGSYGVQAAFGTHAIGTLQQLVSTVWGEAAGQLSAAGPIKGKEASQLHITNLLHGSFGFLLEEVGEVGEPLFKTSLHDAADRAVEFLSVFAGEDEERFADAVDDLNPRIFSSLREFFGHIYKSNATFRMVEGDTDIKFDRSAIQRAWQRAEASEIEEDEVRIEGKLLGIIPVKRRFEFEADGYDKVIDGKVGDRFTESYLERMNTEQFAGRRWKALLRKRTTRKAGGREVERVTLVELEEIQP